MKKTKLYVDLDGVLVDFERGYADANGGVGPSGDDNEVFWAPVKRTEDFWLNLPWMPGGQHLWDFVKDHEHLVVLSSPGHHDTERATQQKKEWVRKHLGPDVHLVLKQSKEKHFYACPRSILIDDWKGNIKRWADAGGIAIRHRQAADTIEMLKQYY